MEPGTALYQAMQKAQIERRTFFVYESMPGSNAYAITAQPPDRETYFKVEPGHIITTVVGLCSHPAEKAARPASEEREQGVEKLGGGFWYYRRDRNMRPH